MFAQRGVYRGVAGESLLFHLILNAYWEPLDFELPAVGDRSWGPWRRWIDTFLDSPQGIVPWQTAASVPGDIYRAGPHFVVVLFAGLGPEARPVA